MAAVVVAPREITDLVDRASRVFGCGVGAAVRVAADVCHCEIHHGAGVTAWLEMCDRGVLAELAGAARALDGAAIDVAAGRSGRRQFAAPVPCVLLSRALAAWAQRGVVPVDWPTSVRGVDMVDSIELVAGPTPSAALLAAAGERRRAALEAGLAVDSAEWERLEAAAAGFLLAEAVLDAADEHG